MVSVLITKKSICPVKLIRTFKINEKEIFINDIIQNKKENIKISERHVPYHMGSARYCDHIDFIGTESKPIIFHKKNYWQYKVPLTTSDEKR
jgi:hypothetical protein